MRVAAAVIAKKWLATGMASVRGHLPRSATCCRVGAFDWDAVEANPFFWPDAGAGGRRWRLHGRAAQVRRFGRREVTAVADGVPPGWGEPVYGKLDADLARR